MDTEQRIAQVIVDVPTQQTDRPFDYAIPDALLGIVRPGMRVTVPFGVRTVEGFVVGLSDTSAALEVKPLSHVLDDEPVVTDELLALSQAMQQALFTFRVSCLQAMLPRIFRVHYEKRFRPTHTLRLMERRALFDGRDTIPFDTAEAEGNLAALLKLKAAGRVQVEYRAKDQVQVKTEQWVQPLLPPDTMQAIESKLSKTATKQRLLCEVLAELDGARMRVTDLKQRYDLQPTTLKAGEQKGWLKRFDEVVDRDPYADQTVTPEEPKSLNVAQQHAYDAVSQAMDDQRAETFLLEGVTGSGKTEVYLQLIAHALEQGKTALLLIPEIGLTPQMVRQLKARFGSEVAVLNSRLSVGEQFDEWRKLKEGRAHIAVGPRSVIFAPVQELGIVIIDEEHDAAYKQEQDPRYHARDVAKWRAAYHHCPVVLGSATPSLESRARAQNKRYTRLTLPERWNKQPLPTVEIVDMREEYRQKNYHLFSRALYEAMQETIERGEQIALLLNRRGYANYLLCRSCGTVFTCPNCSVSLTYHKSDETLRCHYCGYATAKPQRCPVCGDRHVRPMGTGTERVERELRELLPNARVVRMDADTTRKKQSYEKILQQMDSGRADILLGTQMIAKGLDFPNLTLVGVINTDGGLNLPDFRASERTFQLLTQVSGRAGRGTVPGRVIFQTFNPDHYAIQYAKRQDYSGFYQAEMRYRKQYQYPPYYYTALVTISHADEKAAQQAVARVAQELRENAKHAGDKVTGPSERAVKKVKNRYYFQVLYQYRDRKHVTALLEHVKQEAQDWAKQHCYLSIDMEPQRFN